MSQWMCVPTVKHSRSANWGDLCLVNSWPYLIISTWQLRSCRWFVCHVRETSDSRNMVATCLSNTTEAKQKPVKTEIQWRWDDASFYWLWHGYLWLPISTMKNPCISILSFPKEPAPSYYNESIRGYPLVLFPLTVWRRRVCSVWPHLIVTFPPSIGCVSYPVSICFVGMIREIIQVIW